MQIKKKTVLFV